MSVVNESSPQRLFNRELSWLEFNSRVLAQAEDKSMPVLERLKFCAIWGSNLDEFFMVRVAGLKDQVAAGVKRATPDGLSPLAQLAEIRSVVCDQMARMADVVVDHLRSALAAEGITIVDWGDLEPAEVASGNQFFEQRILPILTPLAVDPGHPFPYISNLSLNIAVLVSVSDTGQRRFARLKVPTTMPRFVEVSTDRFLPVEQLIVANLGNLFAGLEVLGGWPFRVTRNFDLTLDETAEDLLEAVTTELRRRRFGQAVRLEVGKDLPVEARDLLLRELNLSLDEVYVHGCMIDSTSFWQLVELDRADLQQEVANPVVPPRLRNLESSHDMFARIRQADVLLHHPYESFSASVSSFIDHASIDPLVLAIKITLYRTSGDSPIIDALIRASERGKQVAALVELKARFDEQANIDWARRLEDAGVHVAYGLLELKIHTKVTLVVRDEPDGLRRYCHIGSGNYNPKTARVYEDVGLLTAAPEVGQDVSQLFNVLTGYGRNVLYNRLLVAPEGLRASLSDLIGREMDAPPGTGQMIMKMNNLVDPELIDLLYEASNAGVNIELIIRGICCLRPGVEGLSERIKVRSIIGRYLEHSRIYYFAHGDPAKDGSGPGSPIYYVGSADLMTRNLDHRVEAMVKVSETDAQARLAEILAESLADTALAWQLDQDGQYHRVGGDRSVQDRLEQLAVNRSGSNVVLVEPDSTWSSSNSAQQSNAMSYDELF